MATKHNLVYCGELLVRSRKDPSPKVVTYGQIAPVHIKLSKPENIVFRLFTGISIDEPGKELRLFGSDRKWHTKAEAETPCARGVTCWGPVGVTEYGFVGSTPGLFSETCDYECGSVVRSPVEISDMFRILGKGVKPGSPHLPLVPSFFIYDSKSPRKLVCNGKLMPVTKLPIPFMLTPAERLVKRVNYVDTTTALLNAARTAYYNTIMHLQNKDRNFRADELYAGYEPVAGIPVPADYIPIEQWVGDGRRVTQHIPYSPDNLFENIDPHPSLLDRISSPLGYYPSKEVHI